MAKIHALFQIRKALDGQVSSLNTIVWCRGLCYHTSNAGASALSAPLVVAFMNLGGFMQVVFSLLLTPRKW